MHLFARGGVASVSGWLLIMACSATEAPSAKEADAPGCEATSSCLYSAGSRCDDATRNGTETGIDCGGSCPACDLEPCTEGSACTSDACASGTCTPPVTKICGVGTERPCANDEPCALAADCTSDVCVAPGACGDAGPTVHADMERNGGETGVDCGGNTGAPACTAGQKCVQDADCTGLCTMAETCSEPTANDGKKNSDESDVDCGGTDTAPRCVVGKACVADADCGFKTCRADTCRLPSSTDTEKNGNETDIDCGGEAMTFDNVTVAAPPRCAAAKTCAIDGDCAGSLCAENKKCVEAPSCRPLRGGYTCGPGETATNQDNHESCCISYPTALTTVVGGVTKTIYVDKYEITAGRVRAWLTAIRAQYGGAPNVQEWVRTRNMTDTTLAGMIPASYYGWLPSSDVNQPITDSNGDTVMFKVHPNNRTNGASEFYMAIPPDWNNFFVTREAGLWGQVGPTSYHRGVTTTGSSGCGMYSGGYGHRTLHESDGLAAYHSEPARGAAVLAEADDKAMNCMPPMMFAAFCAWDGGYLISRAALMAAYGGQRWPWGAVPAAGITLANERTHPGNFNFSVNNTPFTPTRRPAYNYPVMSDESWANDLTPLIAPPGRFPGDIASVTRPGQPSWMDLGGNFIEWSFNSSNYYGWTGGSWEGHDYGPSRSSLLNVMDKYGKGGARCMRYR